MKRFTTSAKAAALALALTVANNYIYGAFGLDYTAGIFTETNGGTNANQQVYNNVLAMTTTTQSSNGAIDVQMGASGLLANNTVVGIGSANGGTGINIISGSQLTQKNNLVQGFQYMESTSAGVTFGSGGLEHKSLLRLQQRMAVAGNGRSNVCQLAERIGTRWKFSLRIKSESSRQLPA